MCCTLGLKIVDTPFKVSSHGSWLKFIWNELFPWFWVKTRDGDRYLEQTPFCFLPWGCPLFQIRHTHFEFPATFGGKMQKCLFQRSLGLEPGTSCVPAKHATSRPTRIWWFDSVELWFYLYVAGNSNWECPTWNKGHPHLFKIPVSISSCEILDQN